MTSSMEGSSTRRAIAAGFVIVLLAALLALVVIIRDILLLGFFSVLLASILTRPIDLMSRVMPRGVATLLCVAILIGAVALGVFLAAPVVLSQLGTLAIQLQQAGRRLAQWWFRAAHGPGATLPGGASMAERIEAHATNELATLASKVFPFAFGAFEVVSAILLALALAFFLAYQPDGYRAGLHALAPRRLEADVDEAWRRIGTTLKQWTGGIVLSMAVMGALTGVGLWAVGVDAWFTLALLTFFGTFVPFAGAVVSALPGLAVGLADSPTRLLHVSLVYVGVHFVEGYLIGPLIMKRAVELRPALLLFWQMLMGSLFGLLGLIVATPLLACMKEAVGHFYLDKKLGKHTHPA